MERTLIKQTPEMVGTTVKLQGWAETVRDMGKLTFIDLRDRTGKIQIVGYQLMKDVTTESVIEIVGEVKKRPEKMINPDMITGTVEIDVKEYKILSKSEPLPIPVIIEQGTNETESEKRMDYRWIDLRKEKNNLIFKVWTTFENAAREYFIQNEYMQMHSPKLIGAPSESGAEVFEVKYFEGKAYLAQSPQFYKQMAMAAGYEKVFEFGPVFRAENSYTIRHATEFTGMDLEISYIESYKDVMAEEEKLIAHIITRIKEKHGEEIKKILGVEIVVPTIPFPKMTIAEAKVILGKLGLPSEKEGDLSSEEEKALGKYALEELGHEFIFLTEYPQEFRAFYHMRSEDGKFSQSADLIHKGLEITTLAQREHRYEVLKAQALERGISQESIQFYLDFFRYGCPPHGGLGFGPARFIMKLLDQPSIRETTYLFRNPKRLNP